MSLKRIELVQAVYAAFGRRDEAALASLIAPDIVIKQSSMLPWGGTYSGHAGMKKFLATLFGHVDSRVEFEHYIDAGEHVAAVGWVKGTVRANGNAFTIPIVHVWGIRNGRAVSFNPYIENATMLAALHATDPKTN